MFDAFFLHASLKKIGGFTKIWWEFYKRFQSEAHFHGPGNCHGVIEEFRAIWR
jgi:hypothetical protein